MTLVIYMGMNHLPQIVDRLRAGGMPDDMPAAVIEQGTLPAQRQVLAPLATLADAVRQHGIGCPALVIVGPTVTLARAGATPSLQIEEEWT